MNLHAFTLAGLRQAEIGNIVGVSHNTIGFWMRGRRKPHALIEGRVNAVLKAVQQAVDNGELPLPADTPRNERMQRIRAVVEKYM